MTTPALTTSNWRPTLDEWHPTIREAADRCAKFIADMEAGREPYWLTLRGSQGVGKTMMARQVFEFAAKSCNPGRHSLWVAGTGVYEEANRRPRCVWYSAAGFKDAMLGGDYGLPEYLRADYLVAIDDLGAAKDTRDNALADGLYRLADQRSHRWMIWTTNLTLNEISERLDPRISSRLIRDDNRLVSISAGDYALRQKGAA
jgi:hypothetical protein